MFTTCYCTFIGGKLVTLEEEVAKCSNSSSAKVEYKAMKKLTNELMWIKKPAKRFGIETTSLITMHCDN